ncbi:MAG: AAA family ATPase [Actinomycetota bacterium]|nr:AAA family ATPase [Actinomycetota bacterium]
MTRDAALSDAEVLALCRRAGNAAKFEGLYDRGDTAPYRGDDSAADLALVGVMAFFTQDPDQLDRLFRGSALCRDKWLRRPDYRRRTIERVLERQTETYFPPGAGVRVGVNGHRGAASQHPGSHRDRGAGRKKPQVVRLSSVKPPGPRRYVVDGLIAAAYIALLHGDGGVAKSLLALSLAVAVAGGRGTWLERRVEGGPVLYLDFELTVEEQARRVWQLCRGAGLEEPPENLLYLGAVEFGAREAFEVARETCEERGVKLLVVDSYGVALQGDAEASRDVIAFQHEVLGPFRELGAAVLLIDHQSKLHAGQSYQSKGAFGSVYKSNLARSVVQAEATDRGEGTLTVRLRQKKHNFGPLAEPFGAKLTFSEEAVGLEAVELGPAELAEEGTLTAAERVKLGLADGPAYPWEISDFTGVPLKTVKNALTGLRKQGVVEPTGEMEGRTERVRLIVPRPVLYKGTGTRDATNVPPSEDLGNVLPLAKAPDPKSHALGCQCVDCEYGEV